MHALEHIKVVNFGSYIAGSHCGALLGDLGADVIKVETLEGDPLRGLGSGFLAWSRAQKNIAIDLKKEKGLEIVRKLISRADVIIENFRPGVPERLGVDYETARKLRPDIVYVSLPGHGSTGPYRDWAGFDPLLQARGGVMAGQGGKGKPPVFLGIAVSDYAGAMLGAYGAVLALWARSNTGQGQHVESSLTNAVISVQSGEFLDFPGKLPFALGGTDLKGLSATCRLYKTADRWIFVLCLNENHWHALCRALGREDLAGDGRFRDAEHRKVNEESLISILQDIFVGQPAAHWQRILDDAGAPCSTQVPYAEMAAEPHNIANDLIVTHEHPTYGRVTEPGVPAHFSETPGTNWRPPLVLGENTDEVLTDLGYNKEGIAALRAGNIIK